MSLISLDAGELCMCGSHYSLWRHDSPSPSSSIVAMKSKDSRRGISSPKIPPWCLWHPQSYATPGSGLFWSSLNIRTSEERNMVVRHMKIKRRPAILPWLIMCYSDHVTFLVPSHHVAPRPKSWAEMDQHRHCSKTSGLYPTARGE